MSPLDVRFQIGARSEGFGPAPAVDISSRRAESTSGADLVVGRFPQRFGPQTADWNCGIPQLEARPNGVQSPGNEEALNSQQNIIEGLLQFVTLAESERKLMAADLHDQTLSDLREMALLARRLYDKPPDAMTNEVRDGLAQIVAGVLFRLSRAASRAHPRPETASSPHVSPVQSRNPRSVSPRPSNSCCIESCRKRSTIFRNMQTPAWSRSC